jgi:PPOX class probable FMN-dependent enzyme
MPKQHELHRIRTLEQLREIIGTPSPPVTLDVVVGTTLDRMAREFIAASPFLLLATADSEGRIDISPKGDPAGFVHIENDTTLVIPDRKGNKLAIGHQNLLENPAIALLFLIPGTGETLRVTGSAELTCDPDLLPRLAARGKPPQLAIRVFVREVFFHCPRALMRSELWNPAKWPERHPISVGRFLAERLRKNEEFAEFVDHAFQKEGI